MATQTCSSPEEERQRQLIVTLRARIRTLEAEVERLRKKLESTWGEA